LARRPRDALPSALSPAGRWFGERVLVPAGVLSLLTGMGLVPTVGSDLPTPRAAVAVVAHDADPLTLTRPLVRAQIALKSHLRALFNNH
jgi:hypothetical protein